MRIAVVQRSAHAGETLRAPHGAASLPWSSVVETLDRHDVPDGLPFIVDDDGSLKGCHRLNTYLLTAWRQRAYDLDSLRSFHTYHLARLLRFVRERRGGELVDLTATTTEDLTAYRDARQQEVQDSTLATEFGCFSSFFYFATQVGWMDKDPIPRWGRNNRNTLVSHKRRERQARFLKAAQTRHFLEIGLRGDGYDPAGMPGYPERDYVYGLLLATTGLRRAECALLLDAEVPVPETMGSESIHVFDRLGKKQVIRSIYITAQVAHAADLYRQTERHRVVQAAQRSLRAKVGEGSLLVVDDLIERRGKLYVATGSQRIPVVRLTDKHRAQAVRVLDDGTIDPLALFVSRSGLPPGLERWNQLFADARERVRQSGHPDRPPRHVHVTPHTMRHSYAVRMLAALMKEGRSRAGDPYLLLANPVLTVKELLGHASVQTTLHYLHAAETWTENVPAALAATAADLVGHTESDPGPDAETIEDDWEPDASPITGDVQ
ncbi:site-specific recombinase XerD [Mycolicibacterium fortuitum]|uniref:Site-specific recombinase XerD n=1 Tax=Mycolicibacterium fortuitum TaxID=1766 RepID=A0A378U6X4_MYCFO|nr:site-specific recombinase XerD [Mycolicibacterium fortuitum]